QGIALQHDRVADAFRSFAVGQFAVQLNSLLLREVLLLELELGGEVEQAQLLLFLGNDFVEECEVVAEAEYGPGIVHPGIFADIALEEDRGHGRDVFVAEAEIGAGETGVSGLDRGDAYGICRRTSLGWTGGGARPYVACLASSGPDQVAGENLFRDRHRAALARALDLRQRHLALHARHVERKQAAVFDHLAGDLILARRELGQGNLLSAADAIDQGEIRRGQQAQVLAVLLVDAFDVLGDDHADSGAHLGIRRLLAARALAAALSAHGANEAAALHVAPANRRHVAALQSKIWNLPQGLVEVKAIMRGRNLVGGNVVAQLGIVGGICRVPGQVLARQLPLDQLGIFSKKKNAPLQLDSVRPLFDFTFQK